VGESQVLEFRWVNKIAIGNPSVADVVALSDNQVLVNGKTTGETNLFVWDKRGQHEFKVAVGEGQQDLTQVARTVSRELGKDDIQVRAIGDSLFLFGQVKSQAEQQQAEAVAVAYTKNVKNFIQLVQDGQAAPERPAQAVADALNEVFRGGSVRARPLNDGTTVVLEGSVTGEQAEQARRVAAAMGRGVTVVDVFGASAGSQRQVLVRARVVDIDKVKGRELGVDWGPVQIGANGIRIVGEQPFQFGESRSGPIPLDGGGPFQRFDPIGFKLRALERQNAARVLSEPNILVMEGNKSGILIGGEIPIPVAQQAGSGVGTSITVEYKPFGIRLDVEAIRITDEEVTLRISPEVSSLDYTNAVTVNGFNLPALRTRRSDSVVRIRNGQTLAIAGLLQNDMNRQTKAIPLLSKIPILGQFFKDTRFQKGQSELVILVTPELPGPDNTVSTPIPNVEIERPDVSKDLKKDK
jgi:pilus assembly protein CpaC